jgi:hypothetical protein
LLSVELKSAGREVSGVGPIIPLIGFKLLGGVFPLWGGLKIFGGIFPLWGLKLLGGIFPFWGIVPF